jgi:SNF2 family DNA or RNA helicase
MKVSCIFTLNELKKIVPSLEIEHFKSDNPKVKEALNKLFWNLGCTLPNKVEIDEGLVTLNKFGEQDDSPRISCFERSDSNWLKTRFASHQVRCLTDDVGMMRELDSISNARSYAVTTGVELV